MPSLLLLVFWLLLWPLARVIALEIEAIWGTEPSQTTKRAFFYLDMMVYITVAVAILVARMDANEAHAVPTPYTDLLALAIWIPCWPFTRAITLRLDIHRGWDITSEKIQKALFGIDMFIWFLVAFALVFLRR